MPRNVRMAVVLRNADLPLESWLRAERAGQIWAIVHPIGVIAISQFS